MAKNAKNCKKLPNVAKSGRVGKKWQKLTKVGKKKGNVGKSSKKLAKVGKNW